MSAQEKKYHAVLLFPQQETVENESDQMLISEIYGVFDRALLARMESGHIDSKIKELILTDLEALGCEEMYFVTAFRQFAITLPIPGLILN